MSQFHKNFIIRVITLYGLELDGHQVDTPIDTWFQIYDPTWIVKAIVESLYRGRYKIKSIDNILKDWQRLGKPRYGYTPEYERGILRNLPEQSDILATPTPLTSPLPVIDVASIPADRLDTKSSVTPPALSSKNLNPEESAPFQRHDLSLPIDRLDHTQFGVPISESQNLENADRAHNSPEDSDRKFGFLPSITSEDEKDSQKRGEIESGSGEIANNFVVNSPVGHPEGWLAAQLHTSEHYTSNQQFPLALASLETGQGRRFASSDLHNGIRQIVSQPVKHRLFNILKAIVDPNNQQQVEEVYPSVSLPLYIVNTNSSSNKGSIFPLENTSEEQCL